MKKNLLIMVLVLLFCGAAKAQNDYRSMAVEGAHWVVYDLDGMDPRIATVTGAWEYYCHGDTVINQIMYKKIYRRYLEAPESAYSPRPFYPISSYMLVALMRDDIEARKVHAVILDEDIQTRCPVNDEVILYEFPLQAGSSVDFCLLSGTGMYPYIYEISENQLFGETIKEYWFISDIYSVRYIEGIGTGNGLFEKIKAPGVPSPPRGFYARSIFTITVLRYYCLDCEDQFVSTEDYGAMQANIRLAPNPANETVRIQLLQPESITGFQVCNLYGTVLHTQTTGDKTEYRLDAGNLAAGTYLVYFYNNTQIVQVKKLLVTH